jgi:hypothetical protein
LSLKAGPIAIRITHGEVLAPAIRPDIDQHRPGGPIIRHVHGDNRQQRNPLVTVIAGK